MAKTKQEKKELRKKRARAAAKYVVKETARKAERLGVSALATAGKLISPFKTIDTIIDVAHQSYLADNSARGIANKQQLINSWNHPEWYGGESNYVSGVNSVLTRNLTDNNEIITTLTQVVISPVTVDETDAFILSKIQDVINSLATARGYTSSLTADKILQYLRLSEEVYSLIVTLKRNQEVVNIKSYNGLPVGTLLTTFVHQARYFRDWVVDGTGGGIQFNWGVENISNTTWVRDVVSALDYVYISPQLKEYIDYHFGAFFSADVESAYDSVVALYPEVATEVTPNVSPLQVLRGKVETMLNYQRDYPDLVSVLRILGFTPETAKSEDMLNRDLSGQTFLLRVDSGFQVAMNNSLATSFRSMDIPGDSFLDELFWIPNPNVSVIKIDESVSMSIGQFMALAKFRERATIYALFNMDDSGEITAQPVCPPMSLGIDLASYKGATNEQTETRLIILVSQINRITRAMTISSKALPSLVNYPFAMSYIVKYAGPGDIMISDYLLGGDAFRIPDWRMYQVIARTNLTFNGDFYSSLITSLNESVAELTQIR